MRTSNRWFESDERSEPTNQDPGVPIHDALCVEHEIFPNVDPDAESASTKEETK